MNRQSNAFLWTVALVALVIAIVACLVSFNSKGPLAAGGTRFPNGISADSTLPASGQVRGTTLAITSTSVFSGLLTLDGGNVNSYTNSTSSIATSQTLAAADVASYNTIVFSPGATNGTTLTFPATSTLPSTFLPSEGDWTQQCWLNSTSTATAKITLAAGTGWDFEVASTSLAAAATVAQSFILPGNSACLRFIRQKATATTFDITAQLTTFVDGD